MRLSFIQKDILFLLYAFELKGHIEPVEGMVLLNMINDSRHSAIADRNFRVSCHTLAQRELITMFRDDRLKLSWKLTELGADKAQQIYYDRLEKE